MTTSSGTATMANASAIVRRRFTVDEYYLMADAGIFGEDDRVELVNGEIVEMAAIGSYHASCVLVLTTRFSQMLGGRALVNVQNPIHLSEYSEPQPDVVLLRPRDDFYRNAHATPQDVLLVVEVSHSTVEYDRDVKVPLYAGAGIAELWLVDLEDGYIDVFAKPVDGGYTETRRVSPGESVAPGLMPDASLDASEVLGVTG